MQDNDLRWRLRQLPARLDPPHDLWPGIADRIRARPARRSRRAWIGGLALAASVCVAVGLAWSLRVPPSAATAAGQHVADAGQGTPNPGRGHAGAGETGLLQREADALAREYHAALREFDGAPMPATIEPALATLDRSAADLRGAIASDPDAVFLLDQLRRTYARRLSLTQRAATG
jgi:hypothetical protein